MPDADGLQAQLTDIQVKLATLNVTLVRVEAHIDSELGHMRDHIERVDGRVAGLENRMDNVRDHAKGVAYVIDEVKDDKRESRQWRYDKRFMLFLLVGAAIALSAIIVTIAVVKRFGGLL